MCTKFQSRLRTLINNLAPDLRTVLIRPWKYAFNLLIRWIVHRDTKLYVRYWSLMTKERAPGDTRRGLESPNVIDVFHYSSHR